MEAVGILLERNPVNRRLEEGIVGNHFAYCLSRLGASTETSKRRRPDPGQLFNNRKRHHQDVAYEEQREFKERRLQWEESDVELGRKVNQRVVL
ncbi:unnamed protein product [Protopolystoma xenopodis]|uniref:Uncharacterized protein n=1 Tax=Protopolystoma xenopodis TaxID=117903 RepID=A0A3S5BPW9_9PLAT|nr:unnamed protein product [Protopolystoma xenopodis]